MDGDTLPGALVNGSLAPTRRYGIVRSGSKGLPDKAAAGKLGARQDLDQPRPARRHTPRGTHRPDGPTGRRADEKGKIMTRYRKTGRALTTGAALLGALALSGPAQAADRTSIVAYGAYTRAKALSYGANGAVRVCDVFPDGYGVAVRYYRRVGDPQTLSDFKGKGTCSETTDIPSNPIILFTACVVIDSVDYCASPYQDTGR
jgi:hypothetical protein